MRKGSVGHSLALRCVENVSPPVPARILRPGLDMYLGEEATSYRFVCSLTTSTLDRDGVIKFWGPPENGTPRPYFHRYYADP